MSFINDNIALSFTTISGKSGIGGRIKKLEDIFNSIKYINSAPFEYKIEIEDEKISTLIINNFNVMSSSHYFFISLSNTLPVFRVNIDKIINVESFNYIITGNKLLIKIKEIEPLKVLKEKQKYLSRKLFFSILFKKIYNKYAYHNSLLFYLKNLKNKGIELIKYNYLISLKEKNMNEKIKLIYYKKVIKILKELKKNTIEKKCEEK